MPTNAERLERIRKFDPKLAELTEDGHPWSYQGDDYYFEQDGYDGTYEILAQCPPVTLLEWTENSQEPSSLAQAEAIMAFLQRVRAGMTPEECAAKVSEVESLLREAMQCVDAVADVTKWVNERTFETCDLARRIAKALSTELAVRRGGPARSGHAVVIETPGEAVTEWGVSFDGPNPEADRYVATATREDAERLAGEVDRLVAERDGARGPALAPSLRDAIVANIVTEADRATAKFGEQNHTDLEWLAVLAEEVGEAGKELNEQRLAGLGGTWAALTNEITQVAAVCLLWLDCRARAALGEVATDA